jgi:hypothetical protein
MNAGNIGFFDFHLMPCIRSASRFTLKCDDSRLAAGIRFTEMHDFLSAANAIAGKRIV